jgi:hypothetical protein
MKIQRGHCHVGAVPLIPLILDVRCTVTVHRTVLRTRTGTAAAVAVHMYCESEHRPGLEAAGLVPILLCVLINGT